MLCRVAKNICCTLLQELVAHLAPKRGSITSRAYSLIADDTRPVERRHDGVQFKFAGARGRRDAADGHLTAAAKSRDERPLRLERTRRVVIVDARDGRPR